MRIKNDQNFNVRPARRTCVGKCRGMYELAEKPGGLNMVRRNLDVVLMALGFFIVIANIGYLIVEVKPENVRSIIQLTPSFIGAIIFWSGSVLMDMKDGKTLDEAIIAIVRQILWVGLFILIGVLMRK